VDECKPLITGSHGIMLVGPASKMQEPVMLAFLSLRSRDVFVHNVFSRLFIIDDTLKTARQGVAAQVEIESKV